jgi:hypothetical protein
MVEIVVRTRGVRSGTVEVQVVSDRDGAISGIDIVRDCVIAHRVWKPNEVRAISPLIAQMRGHVRALREPLHDRAWLRRLRSAITRASVQAAVEELIDSTRVRSDSIAALGN